MTSALIKTSGSIITPAAAAHYDHTKRLPTAQSPHKKLGSGLEDDFSREGRKRRPLSNICLPPRGAKPTPTQLYPT